MLKRSCQPQRDIALCISAILSFILPALLLFPGTASAHTSHTALIPQAGPTFAISAGFDATYREGSWVPLQITLHNDGPDFAGKVSVNVPAPFAGAGITEPLYTYQTPVSLPAGAQKQVTLYVPFYFGIAGSQQDISVDLLNTNNQKISTQSTTVRSLGPGDVFIGILSDQSSGFGALNQVQLPNQNANILVKQLNTATPGATSLTLPDKEEVLNNFSVIILDYFTTSSLSKEQIAALQSWVNQGGTLITVGGPEWRRTLSPLPADLVPVNPTGTGTLPPGTHLLPVGGPTKGGPEQNTTPDTLTTPVKISTATPQPGSTVLLSAGTTPLIVQAQQGQGQVYYLAFDPTLDPMVGWSDTTNLWKGLLLRSQGDKMLEPDNKTSPTPVNQSTILNNNMNGLLQSLFPSSFPSVWLILLLLIGYVTVLGPVRLLTVRIFKRRDWSWRIVLSTIVLFSLLSYGLAIQQKGTSIISSSVSVIQLNRPGSGTTSAHITTSVGVFVPSEGDFQVHIPGNSLVEPTSNQFANFRGPSAPQQPATIVSDQNGTDVKLPGVEIWTERSLVSTYDSQVPGGITPHLTLQDGKLIGTISSTLPYSLSDVYVLIGNDYQALGRLKAGETRQIAPLQLTIFDNNDPTNKPTNIASQIADSNHLAGYIPNGQTQTDFQRHIAMLSALGGGDYYPYPCGGSSGAICYQSTARFSGPYSNPNGSYPMYPQNRDPLLLDGAPATLIGWADSQIDSTNKVTINGTPSSGIQETMIEAPLDIDFAGQIHLPTSMATGQIVDIQNQGNAIQMQLPGLYTIGTGSMTFEFTLPTIPKLQNSSLIFTEASTVLQNQIYGTTNGTQIPGDVNRLRIYLYNWQTSSWDAQAFSQYSLAVPDAQPYIDAQGRVLLQFINQDTLLGTTRLNTPGLQLQGTISG